jgi:iron complex outermembrane receptor protein
MGVATRRKSWRIATRTVAVLLFCFAQRALTQPAGTAELADLSLEDLANLEITSVSRRAERLSDAPASIFVITGDDIRRSGATSLPEALRLAPNLQVARIDSRQYAITSRGFNGTAASNKLLVLIDGRAVYTPLFSGVFWDAQNTLLEDVERIEVISGPGGTLWGVNAVNGVINVTSRRATDTLGTLASAGTGNLERGVAARHGVRLAGSGAFRVYGKFFDRDNTIRASGSDVVDEWNMGQAGFRADWGTGPSGFTLQGDAYRGKIDQAAPGDVRISGANLLTRWNRVSARGDRFQLQAYFDQTERDIPGTLEERLNTLDLDFQHSLPQAGKHLLTWGAGHRQSRDHLTNSAAFAFLPAERSLHWTNVFLQDEIALRDGLRFTAGAKVEDNVYTGTEFLPSARLAWKPQARNLVWAALSRAVRAPSRIDRELFAPGQPPFLFAGGPGFRSEISNVFELGYRDQPFPGTTYSATVYYADHDHLRSLERDASGTLVIGNRMEGKSTGLEIWGSLQASRSWRLSAGAVLLDQDLKLKPGSADSTVAGAGNDPARQIMLRSSHDMRARQELDLILRYVGPLPNPSVPEYLALDARYAWQPRRDLEFSITGRNLLDRSHPEFGPAAARSEIERGLFLAVRWSL